MAWGAVVAIALSILSGLWTGLTWVGSELREVFKIVIDISKWFYEHFIDVMPKQAKIILFLFLLLMIANPIVSWVLGLTYFCNTDGTLNQASNVLSGIRMNVEAIFKGIETNTTSWDEFVSGNTVKSTIYDVKSPEGIVGLKCTGSGNPVLTVLNIEFLNYRYWVMILIIGMFVKLLLLRR